MLHQTFDALHQNLRDAFRLLRKTPGFTATALGTLALCLGANLTIFAVVDSVLLRPLPFPDAARLVSVFNTYPQAGVPNDGCSLTNYYERRGRISGLDVAAYRDGTAIVGEPGSTEQEHITRVSPDFFSTLGVGPLTGRPFTEEEMSYQTSGVAILTDAFWRQRMNGDPGVIGRTIRVDGAPKVIVGVLPPDFRFLSSKARIYFPLASNPDERAPSQRHSGNSDMIARLQPGVTVARAQAAIDAHNATVEADNPMAHMMADAGFRSVVVPLHDDHVAPIRPLLLLVQAGALFLLLIGAVNLVNLLLVRASGRAREVAIRQAIGASRRRVASGVMVETIFLTSAGGVLGLAVAAAGVGTLRAMGVDHLPLGTYVAFDARVAAIALAAAVAIGIVMSAPIAWYSVAGDPAHALHGESRSSTAGLAAQRMRHGSMVAQIALAFVLLSGASLLGLSLKNVMAISPGFQPERVSSAHVSLPWGTYGDGDGARAFVERLTQELLRQPGVLAVGVGTNVPFSGISNKSAATVKGHVLRPGESPRGHYSYSIGGDYFAALGFSLSEGRFLTAGDSRRPERVCVVDEDFARRYWPQGGAIGQQVLEGPEQRDVAEAFTIVGVVGAVKQAGLTEDERQGAVFYPFGHRPDGAIYIVARTSLPPDSLATTLERTVRTIDPDLPVSDVRSMDTRLSDTIVGRRSPALLAGVFSAIAVLLTAIGTYGVLSYAVARRRREIGVRMALGARPDQIRGQFVSLCLRLLAAGSVAGLVGAWLTGEVMQTMLFDVPAIHAPTLAAATAIIAAVSIAACLVPFHRAARVSPVEALASE